MINNTATTKILSISIRTMTTTPAITKSGIIIITQNRATSKTMSEATRTRSEL